MSQPTYLEVLDEKLKQVEEQREALLKLIALEKGHSTRTNQTIQTVAPLLTSSSVRGRIVDAIIEMIHARGRQVRSEEILAYIEEKQLSLGNTKNKDATLAAILSQEIAKKSARLRRVERGVYDLK
jgi:DNA replication protein DnaD